MRHLARQCAGVQSTSAREIAEQYDIPIELLAKVLQRLVRTRLLVSTQGTRGGYALSRAANLISVADVIQAIDGPLTVTACSTEKNDCEQYSKCSIRDPLWQIRERIVAALADVTLSEMAADTVGTAPVAVMRSKNAGEAFR
jgi:Rrf2 family protein